MTNSPTDTLNDADFMRDVLQRIATGPTLSKDITRQEARRAMRIVLEGHADEVQAGIFLIALRMKRETDEELAGILDAIHDGIKPCPVAVDELVTIVDPYDGYLRGTPVAPFLPAVLAACGLCTLSHGVLAMGPKFGASHESVLLAAGLAMPVDREQATAQIANDQIGWAYLPQQLLAPELAALAALRTRIVKRPCLTTIEVAVNSMQPRHASHLVTGYVHKPYPPVYARLAKQGGFDSSITIRGVEGGVVPSLTQASRYFSCEDGEQLIQVDLQPADLGINVTERAVPLPEALCVDSVRSVKAPENPFARELASHAAQIGLAALRGESGPARDSLVFGGAVVLHARGIATSLQAAAVLVEQVLDGGAALARFNRSKQAS